MGLLKAWSYSRYAKYKECPFKLKCSAIDKLKEPSGFAAERGTEVHAKAESAVKGFIQPSQLPLELSKFKSEFTASKEAYTEGRAKTERDLAIDSSWKPSTGTSWDSVWCRALADLTVRLSPTELLVVDYKTGKQYDSHEEQGELYAPLSMIHEPEVKTVYVEFWYLDSGAVADWTYKRGKLPALQNSWNKKVAPMMEDIVFKAKPSSQCSKCHFRKSNGGPCLSD